MADNKPTDQKQSGVLSKIRAGVAAGVGEEVSGAKEAAIGKVYDVPVFGTIIKNIVGQFDDKKDKKSKIAEAATAIDSTLRNIEKSIIQISDNIYNIAGVVGAQLSSLQETEESLRQQKEENERSKEESAAEARKAGPDARPVKEDKKEAGGILGVISNAFGSIGSKAGNAIMAGARGLLSIITNPYVLVAGLVAAIGTGIYKYFTDDGFKKSIDDIFQNVMDFDVAENIIKPLSDIFVNIGAGLSKLAGMMINFISDIGIPIPEFAQKLFGLPAELKPFGFMKGAGESLEGWADKIFKERRDEAAAKKAAEKAAVPPPSRPSFGPPGVTGKISSGRPTKWSESVESAYTRAMPAVPAPNITGDDKSVMAMIESHEGVRYTPYKDSNGLWTVGVGHLIGDGSTLPTEWNRQFSREEINALFAQDYATHKAAAQKIPGFSNLNNQGQAALIDLTFNMGPSWYKKWPGFTKALQEGDAQGAVDSLRNSKWYTQVGQRGPAVVSLIGSGFKKNGETTTVAATPAATPPSPVLATAPAATVGAGSTASLTVSPSKAPGAQVAAAAPTEPTMGTTIGTLSSTVKELKTAPQKNNIAINNSQRSDSRLSSLMSGEIPSPIADRCSFDRYNFFEPTGNMKVA